METRPTPDICEIFWRGCIGKILNLGQRSVSLVRARVRIGESAGLTFE